MFTNEEVAIYMKKFYKENRVFVILMGVALVCIAIIVAMLAGYVVKSTTGNKYGSRLDGISDVEIDDQKQSDLEAKVLEMNKVEDVKIIIHGKTINFNIDFQADTTIAEAQSIAPECLKLFDEDYLNFYDIQFIYTKKSKEESLREFPAFGYRKAQASAISWSVNTQKK